MNLSILRYCLSLPKCSIYRRYRLKILRREFAFEFGHVPIGVAALTFVGCALFTVGLCWLVTLMIQG